MLKKGATVITIAIASLMFCWQPHFMNKFRPGFFFEKYDSAKQANAALLKLHPVGSEVKSLLITLDHSGAKKIYEWHGDKHLKDAISKNVLRFRYNQRTFKSLFPRRWRISVHYDDMQELLLISIGLDQGV